MPVALPKPYSRFTFLGSGSTLAEIVAAWQDRCGLIFRNSHFQGSLRQVEPYLARRNFPFLGRELFLRTFINTEVARDWYDKDTVYCELLEFARHGIELVRPGDTVFDCGAHHGVYSMVFADAVGPSGRVVAFEPVPINAQLARLNADINGYPDIEVFPLGLGAKDHTITVSMQAHSTAPTANRQLADTVEMQITTLDRFAGYKPDFIKLDIEGAEVDALIGAGEILRSRPRILISVHPPFISSFNHSPRDIFNWIPAEDYDCLFLYPGRPIVPYDGTVEMETFCELLFLPK